MCCSLIIGFRIIVDMLIVSQLVKNPSEFNEVCEFITVLITSHNFSKVLTCFKTHFIIITFIFMSILPIIAEYDLQFHSFTPFIHSFSLDSVLGHVHSLFQSELSVDCYVVLLLS